LTKFRTFIDRRNIRLELPHNRLKQMKLVARIPFKAIVWYFFCATIASSVFAQLSFSKEHYVDALIQARLRTQQPIATQDSTISLLSHWNYGRGGPVSSTGNYVFVANGGTIQVVDATSDEPYKIVSEVEVGNPILSILADDSLLFTSGNGGFHIFDISQPTDPVLLGRDRSLLAYRMVREDNRVFMTSLEVIYSVDISDLTTPHKLAENYVSDRYPTCIAVKDDYLYVADNFFEFGIKVFDATAFDSLNWVTTIRTNTIANSAQIVDSLLYLFGGVLDCAVYNISDPLNAQFVTYLPMPIENWGPTSVAISGNSLFLKGEENSLLAIDISNPTDPFVSDTLLNSNTWLDNEGTLAAAGERVYSGYLNGIQVADINNPAEMVEELAIPLLALPRSTLWQDDVLYISCSSGFWIFDVSNPVQPELLNTTLSGILIHEMLLDNNILYAVTSGTPGSEFKRGLMIFDMSDRLNPQLISYFPGVTGGPSGRWITGLTKSENIVALTLGGGNGQDSTLQFVDVTDIHDPQSLSILSGIQSPWDVAISGNTAYIGSLEKLFIIDIADPTLPTIVNTIDKISYWVSVFNNRLFLLSNVLSSYELNDPINPGLLGELQISTNSSNVLNAEISESYLYWSLQGFGVVDINDPAVPEVIEYVDDYTLYRITAARNNFATVSHYRGLQIYQNNETPLGIGEELAPTGFSLYQNSPNPFNPSTNIEFTLDNPATIKLEIFDINGRYIRTLTDRKLAVGNHSYYWDGRNDLGGIASSGVYFYRLSNDKASQTRKMILIR